MRLLLLSDIHANLEALEACLTVAPAHDLIMNLGDIVGYNASPNEVCERVRELGGTVVRGNHDRACTGLLSMSEFNLMAALSARWTQEKLEPEHLNWLRALPQGPLYCKQAPGAEFVHGSPRDEDEYVLNSSIANADFRLPGHAGRIFFGHTHLQGGFVCDDGKVKPVALVYPAAEEVVTFTLRLEPGKRYLINPGSVGQPRDGDCRAAFALYEAEVEGTGSVTYYRAQYDVESAQQRILDANLPERLAHRLALGK